MKRTLGFIGGGKSTRIILNAIHNRKLKFRRVVVSDVNPLVIERLRNNYSFVEAESASVAAGQSIVFLSMEQDMFMDTLGLISSDFSDNTIIVSLAPDITFARLALRLQNFHRIARVIPSTAAYINDAYIPVSFSSGFSQNDKDNVLEFFGNFGKAVEIPEEKLQTYSGMSAVLQAYFWYQWDEMIKMGTELGLTRDETLDFISDSMRSSLNMKYRSGMHEGQVADLMPLNPVEENEAELRDSYRKRLIELYRRQKPVHAAERGNQPRRSK